MNLKTLISLKLIFHLLWMGLLFFVVFFMLGINSDCNYIEENLNSQINTYKTLVDSVDFNPEVINATESKINSLKLKLLELKSEQASRKNDLLIPLIIIMILNTLTMNYFEKRITKAKLDEQDKGEML